MGFLGDPALLFSAYFVLIVTRGDLWPSLLLYPQPITENTLERKEHQEII